MFNENDIYIIGDAKSATNNPITKQYNGLFIGLVVDTNSDKIIDFDCSTTINLTAKFLRSIFIGENMKDAHTIIQKMESRYHGSSQKGLIVAYRDALKKYEQITKNTALL